MKDLVFFFHLNMVNCLLILVLNDFIVIKHVLYGFSMVKHVLIVFNNLNIIKNILYSFNVIEHASCYEP